MSRITIRHYRADDGPEAAYVQTGESILRMGKALAPRLSGLGLELAFEEVRIVDPEAADRHNLVTLECAAAKREETPLETILVLEVGEVPCEEDPGRNCRALLFEGTPYAAIPPGLVADALFRLAFSAMGGGCSPSGCGSCGCDCGH